MRKLLLGSWLVAALANPAAGQVPGGRQAASDPPAAAPRHVTVSEVRLERPASGSYWVRGTVRNSGPTLLGGAWPRVRARFHARDGALLFEDYDNLASLPAGGRRTFEILFLAPNIASGWDYYRLEFTAGDGRPVPCAGCGDRRR